MCTLNLGLDNQDGSTPIVLKAATLELKGHEGNSNYINYNLLGPIKSSII